MKKITLEGADSFNATMLSELIQKTKEADPKTNELDSVAKFLETGNEEHLPEGDPRRCASYDTFVTKRSEVIKTLLKIFKLFNQSK